MKVAIVTPIPTPYRDPFWNHVAARPGIELDVFYCSQGKLDRPWQSDWNRTFSWEVLRGRNLLSWRGADASCFWNPDIRQRLASGRYDAIVVGGYNHLTMVAAMAHARRKKIPYFMMCESYSRPGASRWKAIAKSYCVGSVMRRAAGTFPTGKLAAEYVMKYGADPERVVKIPNVPDVDQLRAESCRIREEGSGLKKADVDGRPVILFVGRLIPKKRADLLIRAFHRADVQAFARLVIVGDGPEREALQQLTDQLGLRPHIEFAGFVQPSDMVRWYASASLFVLPSSETWGVAAIEALSCQTPVILSNEVGCHMDAVTDRRVGQVVAARDEEQLAEALRNFASGTTDVSQFDAAWAVTRDSFRYENVAERFCLAIQRSQST
jgi:glycosyltransferase involved in cell wall biosynthesis